MSVIPPRSNQFVDFIYVDELNVKYSNQPRTSSKREILIQDMQPYDYAKQYNKIVDKCNNNHESKQNLDFFKYQPKTVHPDKLKIPKYFLTMKGKAGAKMQRLYSTPYDQIERANGHNQNVSQQNNMETMISDGENMSHEDSKTKVTLQQQRKRREIVQEDEFINNYKKQFNNTKAKLLFDKKNQLRFSSIGKQRQDCMKIYDELKVQQQQILIDKITRNSLLKEDETRNKKGMYQFFSSSTENLTNYDGSITQPIQMNNSSQNCNNINSSYNFNNFNNSYNLNNYNTSIKSLDKISNNNNINNSSNASKSMTSLQKIMAQINTPKRDFFFSRNINFSQKKDQFINKILQNVSSLKSLDEDSIIESVQKQIQSNLSSKKLKPQQILHYRSKSLFIEGQQHQQLKSNQSIFTPVYKKPNYEHFSQSCMNLSSSNLLEGQQQQLQQYSKYRQKSQQNEQDILIDNHIKSDGYSYIRHKNQNESKLCTPNKQEIYKTDEDDIKIISNMKQIIKKYKVTQPETHTIHSNDRHIQISAITKKEAQEQEGEQSNQQEQKEIQEIHSKTPPPKKSDVRKAIFDFLTKKKQ